MCDIATVQHTCTCSTKHFIGLSVHPTLFFPFFPLLSPPQSKFEVLEAEVKEINSNKETLKRNLLDLTELQHILEKTQVFFQEVCACVCVCVCVCVRTCE